MLKKRCLGVGLNELLSDINKTETISMTETKSSLRHLPIEVLQPGKYQPRHMIDPESLQELANSIHAKGIIQPLVVRPVGGGNYEIIAGERRWRAAQLASLSEVPVVVREISDEEALALSLIENIQRENLNAIDTAVALERLLNEFGMTHQTVADAVGKSRTMVTNLLRLLDLNEEVKSYVRAGSLEMGHARALLALDQAGQINVANTIISKGLSVRATENFVKQLLNPKEKPEFVRDPNITNLQNQLTNKLCAHVTVHYAKSGKGKLVIRYNSLDELEGILSHIQ